MERVLPTVLMDVRNRWTGDIQFTAEIETGNGLLPPERLGAAIVWARRKGLGLSGANLLGADLRGADLRGADLRGSTLRGADLRRTDLREAVLSGVDLRNADLREAILGDAILNGADLRGADLSGTVLRAIKADLWMTLASAQGEVAGLIAALREGRINGATYDGSCACLVGTLANVRGVPVRTVDRGAGRFAEQWFAMIRPGDRPGAGSGGGFAARMALDWTLEFCRSFGISPDAALTPP